jgi:hypothetical protein
MIEFTPEQLAAFENAREEDLAKWNWGILKENYPDLWEKVSVKDDEGIAFIKRAHAKAKKYLKGQEDDNDYNKWRVAYGELTFLLGSNFDTHPWTQSILTETLWHPYQRIDVLKGIFDMCMESENNIEFFERLEEIS